MEGIIKLFGKVVSITCYSNYASVKLHVKWAKHKTMQECQFSAECFPPADKSPIVSVTYGGPAHLDNHKDATFGFDEKVMRTPYGVGMPVDKICMGSNVFVYARWRKVTGFNGERSHLVLEEVVIDPEDASQCPQEFSAFVTEFLNEQE